MNHGEETWAGSEKETDRRKVGVRRQEGPYCMSTLQLGILGFVTSIEPKGNGRLYDFYLEILGACTMSLWRLFYTLELQK